MDSQKQYDEANRDARKRYYEANRKSILESQNQYDEANKNSRNHRQETKKKIIESTRVNFSNVKYNHVVAMEPGEGVDLHLSRHQDCPEANTVLNHLTTYRNHFLGDPENPEDYNRLREEIKAQYVSPQKQRDVAEKYLLSQGRGCAWATNIGKKEFVEGRSIDALILGCACCGSRSIDVEDSYTRQPLSKLQCLKLDEDEAEQHLDRIERYNLELPIDDTGLTKTFNLWKAWSIWPQKNLKKADSSASYYFLHPELVELIGDDETPNRDKSRYSNEEDLYCAWVCASCWKDVEKGEIPALSLKAGIDYGSYHRVGLEPLTLFERHIISRVRHYAQVVKIESNSGRQRVPISAAASQPQLVQHQAMLMMVYLSQLCFQCTGLHLRICSNQQNSKGIHLKMMQITLYPCQQSSKRRRRNKKTQCSLCCLAQTPHPSPPAPLPIAPPYKNIMNQPPY